jgi:hypothetical protein
MTKFCFDLRIIFNQINIFLGLGRHILELRKLKTNYTNQLTLYIILLCEKTRKNSRIIARNIDLRCCEAPLAFAITVDKPGREYI